MKLYLTFILTSLSFCCCSYGEEQAVQQGEFYLKQEGSGIKYGPFEYKDGAKIVISKQTFVVEKAQKSALKTKMERMIIPAVEFVNVSLSNCIRYIHQESIALDKDSPQGSKGVNIILLNQEITEPLKITLSMRNISLLHTIKYIAECSGMQYKIDNNTVVIQPK